MLPFGLSNSNALIGIYTDYTSLLGTSVQKLNSNVIERSSHLSEYNYLNFVNMRKWTIQQFVQNRTIHFQKRWVIGSMLFVSFIFLSLISFIDPYVCFWWLINENARKRTYKYIYIYTFFVVYFTSHSIDWQQIEREKKECFIRIKLLSYRSFTTNPFYLVSSL
jgi:hypothetical protein